MVQRTRKENFDEIKKHKYENQNMCKIIDVISYGKKNSETATERIVSYILT